MDLAYETGIRVIDAARQKAQMIHNQALKAVETEAMGADEFWSFVEKGRTPVTTMNERSETVGWVSVSLKIGV